MPELNVSLKNSFAIAKTMTCTVPGIQILAGMSKSAVTIAEPILNHYGLGYAATVSKAFSGQLDIAQSVLTPFDTVSNLHKSWEIIDKYKKNPWDAPKHACKIFTDGVKTEAFVRKVVDVSENPLTQTIVLNLPALKLATSIISIFGSMCGVIGGVKAYQKHTASLQEWENPLEGKIENKKKSDKFIRKFVHEDSRQKTEQVNFKVDKIIDYKKKSYSIKKWKAIYSVASDVVKIAVVSFSTIAGIWLLSQTLAIPIALATCAMLSFAAAKYLTSISDTNEIFGMKAPTRPQFA